MRLLLNGLVAIILSLCLLAYAEDKKHGHKEHKSHGFERTEHEDGHEHAEEEHDDHGDRESHDHEESHKEDGHDDHEESGDEHGHGEEAFGEGKAIIAVQNEGEKFKLSVDSEKLLGIKTTPIVSVSKENFIIPGQALVRYQEKLGVFIQENGWYQLLELHSAKPKGDSFVVESDHLKNSMNIVVSGVALLRVAHLQASGQGGKGHAH